MLFRQLDNGLYAGVAEASDVSKDALRDLLTEISKSSPELLREFASHGFSNLPVTESDALREMVSDCLAVADIAPLQRSI